MIRSYKDLKVYELSYAIAMQVFKTTKQFPKEELYSLTDQVRRASRSVTANIVEGWSKRHYQSVFKRHLLDAIGSCDETKLWIDFAYDCKYLNDVDHKSMKDQLEELSKKLNRLYVRWTSYEEEPTE